jgi:hypothetical protein
MAAEKVRVPPATRQAIVAMRKGKATNQKIADALGVPKTTVFRVLKEHEEELEHFAGGRALASAAASELEDGGAVVDADAGSTESDITKLEGELRELYLSAQRTFDPLDRTKIAATISQITSRLAALRRDEAKARPSEADDLVKRAGYAAAAKFRKLVEEALGEKLEDGEDE